MSDSFLSHPFFYSLAVTLIHFIWQGGLIALGLKSLLLLIDQRKPQLRYALASLAMLMSLIVPFITFSQIYQQDSTELLAQVLNASFVMADSTSIASDNLQNYSDWLAYLPYLAFLWLVCVSYLACKLLFELYQVNRLPKDATLPANQQLLSRFSELVALMGMTRQPQLLISLQAKVPMAIGWLKPVILLPANMLTGLTPNQLEMLLLHELAHIRRHDYLVNFLQTLVEILLFFHPAVGWISKQMRNEREYCSDDIAVHHCGNPVAYAHTLADTAELCSKHRHQTIPGMAMAASGGDLKQRVSRLVTHHCATSSNQLSQWLASVAIMFTVILISSQQFFSLTLADKNTNVLPFLLDSDNYNPISKPTQTLVIAGSSLAHQLLENQQREVNSISQQTSEQLVQAKIDYAEQIAQPSANTITLSPPATVAVTAEPAIAEQRSSKPRSSEDITTATQVSERHQENDTEVVDKALKRTQPANGSNEQQYAQRVQALAKAAQRVNQASFTSSEQRIKPAQASAVVAKPQSPRVEQAELLVASEPRYPTMAKRKGIELDVTVHFTVDKSGRVTNIEFEEQNKIGYFRRAIRSAMEKWRFSPATANGKAIESEVSKIFSFNLQ